MAVYKVLQDIEGEDKLIAWLSPKQTIYAAIVIVSCALGFVLGRINIILAIPWLIPIIGFGFLAAPLGRDQPNDVWLAAQIRFFLKNRKRIWDQTGMQELVQITVPKQIEKIYTDGLNQGEVRSRLRALSSTIDSRGWAVKNSNVNLSTSPQFAAQFQQGSDDRLVGSDAMAIDVPISDVSASDDILDAQNNVVAQRFDEEIKRQEQLHKQAVREQMQTSSQPAQAPRAAKLPDDYYFMHGAPATPAQSPGTPQLATFSAQVVAPGSDTENTDPFSTTTTTAPVADDSNDPSAQALLEKIHHDKEVARDIASHSHGRVIRTPAEVMEEERINSLRKAEQRRLEAEEQRRREAQERLAHKQATQTAPDAIIKELSRDSELKVSTLASQAKRAVEMTDDGEVVISLH